MALEQPRGRGPDDSPLPEVVLGGVGCISGLFGTVLLARLGACGVPGCSSCPVPGTKDSLSLGAKLRPPSSPPNP